MTVETVPHREIDWATAEVHDGTLKVSLTGGESDAWIAGFEAVLARLDQSGNHWGLVRPTKRRIKVADVVDGHETELRHFLEAVVLQTNADATGPSADPVAEVSEVDQRMTDAFRAGADSPGEP
jgi:hypothetical protein